MATDKTGKALFDEILSQQQTSAPTEEAKPTSGKALFDSVLKEQSAPKPAPTAPSLPTLTAEDEGTIKKIMDSAAAAGAPVSREEAEQRAARTKALLAGGAPSVAPSTEYTDAGSSAGAAFEGYMRGLLPFDVVGAAEGTLGYLLEGAGLENNPLTWQNIQAREQSNPYIAGAAQLAGIGTTLGASFLVKKGVGLAERGIVKIAEAAGEEGAKAAIKRGVGKTQKVLGKGVETLGTTAQATDVVGKTGKEVGTRLGARFVGTNFGREVAFAENEIGAILARKAEELPISQAEEAVYKAWESRLAPTQLDRWKAALSRGKKEALDVAADEAYKDRARQVIQYKMGQTFDNLGLGIPVAPVVVSGVAGTAAGAVAGGTYALSRAVLDRAAMTPDQRDALGESIAAEVLQGAEDGAFLGGALSLAGATIPQVGKYVSALVRKSNEAFTKLIGPQAARLAGKDPKLTRAALTFGDAAAATPYEKELEKLSNALQHQYDNADEFAQRIELMVDELRDVAAEKADAYSDEVISLATRRERAASIAAGRDPMVSSRAETSALSVREVANMMRKEYMSEVRPGEWVMDKEKLRKALKETPLEKVVDANGQPILDDRGKVQFRVELPSTLKIFQQELEGAYSDLAEFVVQMEREGYVWDNVFAKRARRADLAMSVGMQAEPNIIPPAGFPTKPTAPMDGMFLAKEQPAFFEKLRKGQELAGERLSPTDPLRTELLTTLGGSALLNYLLDIPFIAGVPATTLANTIYKFATNPGDAVATYTRVQSLLQLSQRGMDALTKHLTSTTKYVPRGDVMDTTLKLSGLKEDSREAVRRDSVATGKALYDADKVLLAKVEADLASGNIAGINKNYDILDAAAPKLAEATNMALPRQVAFLSEKLKEATPNPTAFAIGNEPTSRALYKYGVYSRYVRDPDTIFDDIGNKGFVPDEAMEVLTRVYPARLNALRTQLLSELSDAVSNKYRVNAKQQQIIDKILGTSTRGLTPDQIKAVQASFAAKAPAAGTGGGVSNRRVELEREGTSQGK